MLPYQEEVREDGRSRSNTSELNGAKAAEVNEDRHRRTWTNAKKGNRELCGKAQLESEAHAIRA
jgi:hypothetical protein